MRINRSKELENILENTARNIRVEIYTNRDSRYQCGKYCQFNYNHNKKEIRMYFQSDYWALRYWSNSDYSYSKTIRCVSSGPYFYPLSKLETALTTARKKGIRVKRLYGAVKKVVYRGKSK